MKKAIGIIITLIIIAGLVYLGIEAYKTIFGIEKKAPSEPDKIINVPSVEEEKDAPVIGEPEVFYAVNPSSEECEEFTDSADIPQDWKLCEPGKKIAEIKETDTEEEIITEDSKKEADTEAASLPSYGEGQVIVFYSKENENDCSKVYPLVRDVKENYLSQPYEEVQAILMLLVPLTSEEKEKGFRSNIPDGTRLRNLDISGNGIATITFNDTLNEGGGSCMMSSRRAQIEQTLFQFKDIKKVIIKAGNAGEEETLQP